MTASTLPGRVPWRDLVGPALMTAVVVAVLVGLGVWQVERLAWKNALVATIAERTTLPPSPLPPETEWSTLRVVDYAYRHVALTGSYEHDKEAYVFRPLTEAKGPAHGIGYLVMTPLRLPSGAHVVVNRGFVPSDKVDPATRAQGQVDGTVEVTGLMREPESRNYFTPADEPRRAIWFTRDPASIASAMKIERAAPFTVDADAGQVPGGLPQGGETVLDIPNNHLSYALTWFGLAVGVAGVFTVYSLRRSGG